MRNVKGRRLQKQSLALKKHIKEKIHAMKSEMGSLHGEIAKAKRHLEEKTKEKKK